MRTFREGDVVSIEAVVQDVFPRERDGRVYIKVGGYMTASVDPGSVTLISPFLKEGETVRHVCGNYGVVIAVKDRMVWVRDKLGHNHVWHTDSVALVTDDDRSESDAVAESTTVIEIVGASA